MCLLAKALSIQYNLRDGALRLSAVEIRLWHGRREVAPLRVRGYRWRCNIVTAEGVTVYLWFPTEENV